MIKFYDTKENKYLDTANKEDYDYKLPDIVLAPDLRVYELSDNGACGDPECCGDFENYYMLSSRYIIKEQTNE